MSDMKCPFCGRKLEQYWYEDFECWYCPDVACKGYVMTATKDMWQELIRTRKALDVAVDALNAGKTLADIAGFKMLVAGLEEALNKITTLEQKN